MMMECFELGFKVAMIFWVFISSKLLHKLMERQTFMEQCVIKTAAEFNALCQKAREVEEEKEQLEQKLRELERNP